VHGFVVHAFLIESDVATKERLEQCHDAVDARARTAQDEEHASEMNNH
jgi:hypothetical protein